MSDNTSFEIQPSREARSAGSDDALKAAPNTDGILAALLEAASDGIVVVDSAGRVLLINTQAAAMFGYERQELLRQPVEKLLPKRLREAHIVHRADYRAHPRPRPMGTGHELVARRKDGTEFPVEVGLTYVEMGDAALTMSVIVDITARKQIESELKLVMAGLQKRNRDLALLNRASRMLTATLDLQQVIERLLQAVTETIGAEGSSVWLWDEEQEGWLVCRATFQHGHRLPLKSRRLGPGQGIAGWVAQHGTSVVSPFAPDDPRHSPKIDAQVGFKTTSLLSVPLRVRDKILGVLQVVNKAEGTFDADEQALVETMAASAAIAIENAQLVDALRQRTQELQAQNEELDAYAHTVAHDLKNPLGIMTGFATVLEQQSDLLAPDELLGHLCTIAQNGRKATNIIDELLLLASVRKTDARIHLLSMADIVGEAQRRLKDLIQEHSASVFLPEQWPVAMGQAAWVEEVWVNFISNAIKYGGRPPHIELGANPLTDQSGDRHFIRFWVRDNGPGLSPEQQARLFTPFTQFHQVRIEGHGLGLSIVRRIVQKLGGQVGVESKEGQGSLFFFTLPASVDASLVG